MYDTETKKFDLSLIVDAVSHIGQAGAGHLGAVPGRAMVGKVKIWWIDICLFSSSCSVIRLLIRARGASPTQLSNSFITFTEGQDSDDAQ